MYFFIEHIHQMTSLNTLKSRNLRPKMSMSVALFSLVWFTRVVVNFDLEKQNLKNQIKMRVLICHHHPSLSRIHITRSEFPLTVWRDCFYCPWLGSWPCKCPCRGQSSCPMCRSQMCWCLRADGCDGDGASPTSTDSQVDCSQSAARCSSGCHDSST